LTISISRVCLDMLRSRRLRREEPMAAQRLELSLVRAADQGASLRAHHFVALSRGLHFVQPAMINDSVGVAFAPHGTLSRVLTFTVTSEKITRLEVIADSLRKACAVETIISARLISVVSAKGSSTDRDHPSLAGTQLFLLSSDQSLLENRTRRRADERRIRDLFFHGQRVRLPIRGQLQRSL
jgi:hypothetical protein